MQVNTVRKPILLINLVQRGWIIESDDQDNHQGYTVLEHNKVIGRIDHPTFVSIRHLLVCRYSGDKQWWSVN